MLNNLLIHFYFINQICEKYIEISSRQKKIYIYIYCAFVLHKTVMGSDPKSAINRSLFNPICICMYNLQIFFYVYYM